jgi:hypothetical protein
MPQLDKLIWLNLCFYNTFFFWIIYYIVIRIVLFNSLLILQIRNTLKQYSFINIFNILNNICIYNYNFILVKIRYLFFFNKYKFLLNFFNNFIFMKYMVNNNNFIYINYINKIKSGFDIWYYNIILYFCKVIVFLKNNENNNEVQTNMRTINNLS